VIARGCADNNTVGAPVIRLARLLS